jgi:Carboxypeptidase regulatory-like domain
MSLIERIRALVTLGKFQAIVGITAGFLSIGATVWGILFATRAPAHTGEIVMIVQEARSDKPLAAATVELLTSKDALITTLVTTDGQARQKLTEGTYRVRVSHPGFTTETRQIQVLAGHNQEIRIHLAQRPVGKATSGDRASPIDKATEGIRKLLR